jgi:hypothetical protein
MSINEVYKIIKKAKEVVRSGEEEVERAELVDLE